MYTATSLLSLPKRLFLNTIRTATSYLALDESARLVFAFVVTSEGNLILLMVVICPDVRILQRRRQMASVNAFRTSGGKELSIYLGLGTCAFAPLNSFLPSKEVRCKVPSKVVVLRARVRTIGCVSSAPHCG